MFGTYFYNETIKRSISVFGTLFNNIDIKKTKADGTVLTSQKVPISYGPKQKFLLRLQDDAKARDGSVTSISLPRIAFEMTGLEYDPTRQQNKLIRTSKTTVETADTGKRGFQYQPAPYNINFSLSILAKNVIERDYINDNVQAGFTTTEIQNSGLVKEVKHYEPAFGETANAVSNASTVTFASAINTKISANDEVFGTNLTTNPTVVSVAADKLSVTLSANVTIDAGTTLKFVGSVDPSDTFVVAETVTFYDEGGNSTYAEDLAGDA